MSDDGDLRSPAGRANILDVAALAGVSAATVSRSLRGVGKVSPSTRERVLDAARELSYASAFQTADRAPWKRRAVAVIVPFITRWFFSTVTAAAADTLRQHGFDIVLYHLGGADDRDRFFTQMPLTGRVDGLITVSMPLTDEHTLALRALDIPMVSVGSIIAGVPSVGIDEVAAARAATNHLLNLRHEQIGFIAGMADDARFDFASSRLRRLGIEEALAAAGQTLDERLITAAPHGLAGGEAAMIELLTRPTLPTAIVAEYDELAIGALRALRRSRLRVPKDISLVSIDNHEMASMVDLTTIAQDVVGQGAMGAELLISVLDDADVPIEPVILPTQLVLRRTTGPCSHQPTGNCGSDARGRRRAVPRPAPFG